MKKLEIWVNETQSQDFLKRAQHYKITKYALLKELVLIELERTPRNRT